MAMPRPENPVPMISARVRTGCLRTVVSSACSATVMDAVLSWERRYRIFVSVSSPGHSCQRLRNTSRSGYGFAAANAFVQRKIRIDLDTQQLARAVDRAQHDRG